MRALSHVFMMKRVLSKAWLTRVSKYSSPVWKLGGQLGE
jgi:hypothetical protein